MSEQPQLTENTALLNVILQHGATNDGHPAKSRKARPGYCPMAVSTMVSWPEASIKSSCA